VYGKYSQIVRVPVLLEARIKHPTELKGENGASPPKDGQVKKKKKKNDGTKISCGEKRTDQGGERTFTP